MHDKTRAKEKIRASLHGTSPRPPTAASLIARPPLTLAAAAFGTHRWRQAIPWHFTTHMPWHMRNCPLRSCVVGARSAPYCFGVKIARSLRAPSSGFSEPVHHASRISASSSLEVICVAAESAGSRSDRIE